MNFLSLLSDYRVQSGIAVSTFAAGYAYYYFFSHRKKSTSKKTLKSSTSSSTSTSSLSSTSSFSNDKSNSKSSVHVEESAADVMKGYKTTSDGRKTTYFNRELSSEEKKLIGDITPKQISSPAPEQLDQDKIASSSAKAQSAWNTAGTWEEKDHSKWASDKLRSLLLSVSSDGLKISSIQSLDGEASITVSRGKRKFIYDYCASVAWKGSINGVAVTGDMKIADITGEQEYEISLKFASADHQRLYSQKSAVKSFIENTRIKLDLFLNEFQQQ